MTKKLQRATIPMCSECGATLKLPRSKIHTIYCPNCNIGWDPKKQVDWGYYESDNTEALAVLREHVKRYQDGLNSVDSTGRTLDDTDCMESHLVTAARVAIQFAIDEIEGRGRHVGKKK
jgi:hypothetical protein